MDCTGPKVIKNDAEVPRVSVDEVSARFVLKTTPLFRTKAAGKLTRAAGRFVPFRAVVRGGILVRHGFDFPGWAASF